MKKFFKRLINLFKLSAHDLGIVNVPENSILWVKINVGDMQKSAIGSYTDNVRTVIKNLFPDNQILITTYGINSPSIELKTITKDNI